MTEGYKPKSDESLDPNNVIPSPNGTGVQTISLLDSHEFKQAVLREIEKNFNECSGCFCLLLKPKEMCGHCTARACMKPEAQKSTDEANKILKPLEEIFFSRLKDKK